MVFSAKVCSLEHLIKTLSNCISHLISSAANLLMRLLRKRLISIIKNQMNFILDIDECKTKTFTCDPLANCTNTYGSYTCSCPKGYIGDGKVCSGEY